MYDSHRRLLLCKRRLRWRDEREDDKSALDAHRKRNNELEEALAKNSAENEMRAENTRLLDEDTHHSLGCWHCAVLKQSEQGCSRSRVMTIALWQKQEELIIHDLWSPNEVRIQRATGKWKQRVAAHADYGEHGARSICCCPVKRGPLQQQVQLLMQQCSSRRSRLQGGLRIGLSWRL
ncbi:hypothetical protein RIF29_18085 [Crotalaria pallida]|uniref:Uncharacterized protein n=1 Tax=Crotalaria pallida TaxID=3830 RepID=A0AAN9FKL1_CROPI